MSSMSFHVYLLLADRCLKNLTWVITSRLPRVQIIQNHAIMYQHKMNDTLPVLGLLTLYSGSCDTPGHV